MKRFLKVLSALVTLLVIGGIVLIGQIDSDRTKAAIQTAAREASGYELIIGGEVSLDFFPSFGLSLSDVRLRNPAYPQELGSASGAVLNVELAPLLSGDISVQEISADDVHINYFINQDGNSIWSLGENTQSNTNPSSSQGNLDTLTIQRIRIANASIDVQDMSNGTRFRLDQLNLDSSNTNLAGQPFAVDASFDYENNGMTAPVPVNLHGDIAVNLAAGNISIDNLRSSVTPMLINGNVSITGLNEQLAYTGTLSAEAFDLVALLESLGVMEPDPDPLSGFQTNRLLAFDLAFNGDAQQASIPALTIDIAGAEINADASVRMATDFTPLAVSYNVNAGDLDLSGFLPDEANSDTTADAQAELDASAPANPAAQYQPQTELPVELINSLSLLGSITIDSITLGETRIDSINLFTNIEDGVVDIELPPLSVFDGSVSGTLRVNAQSAIPTVDTTLSIADLNLVDLAPSMSRINTVSGFLQAESTYTASGISSDALLASLSGNTAFSITENSVDIGVIKQVFTAIAALSPTGEAIQQWPDVIRFTEMSGYVLLEEGIAANQELQLRMDNFDISGSGGVDLDASSFAYDMRFTVLGEPYTQTIPINELYHSIAWPVECSAAFSDEVSRYCRPDFTQVREIFSQIGSNVLRNELQDTITDQVPEQLQDTARGLLRSILN